MACNTYVAGMKAAAISRIFDIPARTVRGTLARQALSGDPSGRQERPLLGVFVLTVSSDDIPKETLPSWCCGTFPLIAPTGRHQGQT